MTAHEIPGLYNSFAEFENAELLRRGLAAWPTTAIETEKPLDSEHAPNKESPRRSSAIVKARGNQSRNRTPKYRDHERNPLDGIPHLIIGQMAFGFREDTNTLYVRVFTPSKKRLE